MLTSHTDTVTLTEILNLEYVQEYWENLCRLSTTNHKSVTWSDMMLTSHTDTATLTEILKLGYVQEYWKNPVLAVNDKSQECDMKWHEVMVPHERNVGFV